MYTVKLKALASAKARVARLEESIAEGINRELAFLPSKYGFDSVAAFIAAVQSSARSGKSRGNNAAKPKGPKRRTRAKITDDTRAQVKKLVGAGKTGGEIAKTLKISLPSVQNIKKALNLVKPRK